MRSLLRSLLVVTSLAAPSAAAAEPVSLFVSIDGAAVPGDSVAQSLGREGSIECLALTSGANEKNTKGVVTIQVADIVCTKRLDRATPALLRALAEQMPVQLEARFYRPSPDGDGTTQHYYSLFGSAGAVIEVAQTSPDALGFDTAGLPATERVVFRFPVVEFVWQVGGSSAVVP
jgi:type VI secretion system secreted protein Hcp